MAGREERERFVIGRGNDCAITIRDPSLSRQLCYLIAERDGNYKIVYMNSTNGVSVKRDGSWVKVREAEFSHKDFVKLGDYETQVSALLLQLQGKANAARPASKQDVFLSYRRQDAEQIAGRIFDKLVQRYPVERIFYDTEAIPSAVDFRARVQSALLRSAVLLAVMGPSWTPSSTLYQRFLGTITKRAKEDFVQSEIEMAIQFRVPIVPLLVNGAVMPSATALPQTIRDISYLNAISVRSGRDFHPDMKAVLDTIDRYGVPRQSTAGA